MGMPGFIAVGVVILVIWIAITIFRMRRKSAQEEEEGEGLPRDSFLARLFSAGGCCCMCGENIRDMSLGRCIGYQPRATNVTARGSNNAIVTGNPAHPPDVAPFERQGTGPVQQAWPTLSVVTQ